MSFRDRMQTASYRGIEFPTDSHETKGGRRVVVHEYPGGDIADSEDLGAKAWDWKINAYFIGDDYDLKRDEFITMLSTESDPAWLIHPWLGAAWVRSTEWTLVENNDKERYCQITVDFVDAREDPDNPVPDVVDIAAADIDDFGSITEELFDLLPMSLEQVTEFIAGCQQQLEVLRRVISLSQLPLTAIGAINGLIQGVFVDIHAIMDTPGKYANAIRSLYSGIVDGSKNVLHYDRPQLINRLTGRQVTGRETVDPVVRANLQATETLHARLSTAAAADIALTDYLASNDRDAVLSTVQTAIDTLLHGMPDALFNSAVDMRATVTIALLSQDLRPTITRQIANPLPATLLAHRLQMDVDTFRARNKVRHPLFVSGDIYG